MALPQLIAEDMRELDRVLSNLVTRSESSAALIIDKAGFLIGGIVGMSGLLATELATEDPCVSFCTTKRAISRGGASVMGAGLGIALGAVIGNALHHDLWKDVR